MRQTLTISLWVSTNKYYQAEYACEYYYENGVHVGTGKMYATGRTRYKCSNKA